MNRGSVKTDSGLPRWATIAQYILAYLLWFLFCALAFFALWRVHAVLVDSIFFGRVNPWQLQAIEKWSLWIMGAGWVVGIFLSEGYLRKGVEKGRLLVYTGKLFLIPTIAIALSYLIQTF